MRRASQHRPLSLPVSSGVLAQSSNLDELLAELSHVLDPVVDIFLAMIPYAAGLASTVRLGQLLGHNTPEAVRAAKVTVRAAYVFAILVTAFLATGLLVGRFWLAGLYVKGEGRSEDEVRGLIASVLIPIAT